MATVHRFQPASVRLPEEQPLRRDFLDTRSHLPGGGPLDESDYAGFDRCTVFYDICLSVDGRDALAVGPPMANLASALLPMAVSARRHAAEPWQSVRVQRRRLPRFEMLRLRLPPSWRGGPPPQIRFRFANGWCVERQVNALSLPPVYLQWTTLQKNNPVEWVHDWLRYAAALGVQRVLLYDNGSENAEALVTSIETLDAPLALVFIDWPYPYGPVRSYYNNFCQAAQLNHANFCLGASDWLGLLDIDEYPVAPGGLLALLRAQWRRRALLRMDNYLVPSIAGETPDTPLLRARDLRWRDRVIKRGGYKLFVRPNAVDHLRTHNGRVKWGYLRGRCDPAQLYFLHYKSLTTSWKPYVDRLKAEPLDPQRHAHDESVARVFERLGD